MRGSEITKQAVQERSETQNRLGGRQYIHVTEPREMCKSTHREYEGLRQAEVLEKNTEYNNLRTAEVREGQREDAGVTRQRGKT